MIVELVLTAFDEQGFSLNQRVCQFLAGTVVNALDRGPGHTHLDTALHLGHPFIVDESKGFVLIHGHEYRFHLAGPNPERAETACLGQ